MTALVQHTLHSRLLNIKLCKTLTSTTDISSLKPATFAGYMVETAHSWNITRITKGTASSSHEAEQHVARALQV